MYVFKPKRRSPICHVLLTVQNTHRRALLFIDNRQFIGFLHKQNNYRLKPIVGPWRNVKRCLRFRRNSNFTIIIFALRSRRLCRNPRKRVARGEKLWSSETLPYPNISKQLSISCVMEKLLIFYIYEVSSEVMWSSCKRRSGTPLGQWQSGTYLNLTLSYRASLLEQLTTKILKPNSNRHKRV